MHPPDHPHRHDTSHPDLRTGDGIRMELRFCALYREHCGRCRAVARSILHYPDDAEDVVQDLFASLWADLSRTLSRRLGPNYFRTAARNRALDVLKQRRAVERHHERLKTEARCPSHHTPADLVVELARRGTHAALQARMATLPKLRRQVAFLCFEEGLTSSEAARILGVSEKAVEKQRQKLKRDLGKGGGSRELDRYRECNHHEADHKWLVRSSERSLLAEQFRESRMTMSPAYA